MRPAGAVVVALLVLGGCGRDAIKEGTSPSTSSSSTTVDTEAPWSGPCMESSAGPTRATRWSGTVFGPLGDEPSVVVHLPTAHRTATTDTTYREDRYPSVAWARLHEATVVSASPPYTSDAATSLVTAVNDDGSVRWTRCLDGVVAAVGAGDEAELVAVAVQRGAGTEAFADAGDLLLLDADDGKEQHRFDGFDEVLTTSAHHALVGRSNADGALEDLTLVDLHSGDRSDVASTNADRDGFALADDGRLTAGGKVWLGGAWVADPDPPTVVSFDYSADPTTLAAKAGDKVRWRLPLHDPGLEGRNVIQGDTEVVAWTCGERDADGRCPLSLTGVDLRSGKVLWTRRGDQFLGVGGTGTFLVFEDDVWTLRDMTNGAPYPGQRWTDDGAFLQGCCGDYEYHRVDRFGGAVLVLDDTEVRIWLPRVRSHPTVDVRP